MVSGCVVFCFYVKYTSPLSSYPVNQCKCAPTSKECSSSEASSDAWVVCVVTFTPQGQVISAIDLLDTLRNFKTVWLTVDCGKKDNEISEARPLNIVRYWLKSKIASWILILFGCLEQMSIKGQDNENSFIKVTSCLSLYSICDSKQMRRE